MEKAKMSTKRTNSNILDLKGKNVNKYDKMATFWIKKGKN